MSSQALPALVIFGDRTANEVLEAAQAAHGHQFSKIKKIFFDQQRFRSDESLKLLTQNDDVFFVAGISQVEIKSEVVRECQAVGWKPFTVIHPSAVVSPSATVGQGVFVAPLAVISANAKVRDHSIIHIHSSIGHDSQIGEYCSVMPGARISGHSRIGNRTWMGSNSFVVPSGIVGTDCRVDANSYVRNNLPDGHVLSVRWPHPVRRVTGRS